MPRVKGGTVTRARRKRTLKLAKGYFGSVSYTHLDVYKRQPQALFEAQVNIPCEIYADTAIGFANGWEPWYNETWSLE